MKKVTLSVIAALFAISVAWAGSFSQEGYYLWNRATMQFDKTDYPPHPEIVMGRCQGMVLDCYFTLDETGVFKNGLAFRGM